MPLPLVKCQTSYCSNVLQYVGTCFVTIDTVVVSMSVVIVTVVEVAGVDDLAEAALAVMVVMFLMQFLLLFKMASLLLLLFFKCCRTFSLPDPVVVAGPKPLIFESVLLMCLNL